MSRGKVGENGLVVISSLMVYYIFTYSEMIASGFDDKGEDLVPLI